MYPVLTEASERPATEFLQSTVARKKLHSSGQNCASDIFLFELVKAESACYSPKKTCCLWRTGKLHLHKESMSGSTSGCQNLMPAMGVGGSGQPECDTGSTGQVPSIQWLVVSEFWRQGMCRIQYCDSKWPWNIYHQSHSSN